MDNFMSRGRLGQLAAAQYQPLARNSARVFPQVGCVTFIAFYRFVAYMYFYIAYIFISVHQNSLNKMHGGFCSSSFLQHILNKWLLLQPS